MAGYNLKVGCLIAEDRDQMGAWLSVDDGRFSAISDQPQSSGPCIDLSGFTVAPGLIDLHIHGRDGFDVMDAERASLEAISRSLARHGITSFLATTVTSDLDHTLKALRAIDEAQKEGLGGARLLGAYSEGLFFSRDHKGAHNAAYFLPPTQELLATLIAAAGGSLKIVALAPEIDGAIDVIPYLLEQGIRVMIGHTDADFHTTNLALEAGATGGVHIFNGMRGIHHRDPGCAGALLLHGAAVEVIADGHHLHPAILKLIHRLKSPDTIMLISDCINAGGLVDGDYWLGKEAVTVTDGVARTGSGSLAGSTITLDRAVEQFRQATQSTHRQAIHCASQSSAQFLGLSADLGSIAEGKIADFFVIAPSGETMATVRDGLVLYRHPDFQFTIPES